MQENFRNLHRPGDPFVLVNVWDQGGAKVMAALGAKALATSSASHAFVLGRPDMGHVSREEALAHGSELAGATTLPVSGDFENGFGDSPEVVAETVRLAAAAGLAGCSIEDTMLPASAPYAFSDAVARIEAAADAVKDLRNAGGDFVLTARADGVMLGTYDLAEARRRIKAFSDAGADVLYVPLPGDLDAQAEICRAVDKPINALCAGPIKACSIVDFANAGVARISLGSTLARAMHQIYLDAAKCMFEAGDFSAFAHTASGEAIDALLEKANNN